MRHRVVGTVDGQRVLDQVVGADRKKVELARKSLGIERRRRHFYHAAHFDLFVEWRVFVAQALLGAFYQQ